MHHGDVQVVLPRGKVRSERCREGHELTEDNTYKNTDRKGYVHWKCKVCHDRKTAERKRLKRQAAKAEAA